MDCLILNATIPMINSLSTIMILFYSWIFFSCFIWNKYASVSLFVQWKDVCIFMLLLFITFHNFLYYFWIQKLFLFLNICFLVVYYMNKIKWMNGQAIHLKILLNSFLISYTKDLVQKLDYDFILKHAIFFSISLYIW